MARRFAGSATPLAIDGHADDAAPMTDHAHDHGSVPQGLAEFWDDRYAGDGPIWSGRVNATLADVVTGLQPGRALDLGSGEGGDVIWLAQHGWRATGLDVSTVAIGRAARAAADAGIDPASARFHVQDLSTWHPDETYDLVCASFFHSPVDFPRTDVLRAAAAAVVPGGHLLVISHAAFPPWSDAQAHADHADHRLLSPDEERAELDLDPSEWTTVIAETRQRDATGPDGQQAVLDDGVLLMRRT